MTRKAILFIALTFFFSWIILPIYFALGGRFNSPFTLVVLLIYMFVPMTMALIVQKIVFREPLRAPLGISFRVNRWFLFAWLLPAALAIASMGAALLVPGVRFSPDMEGMFERFGATLTPEQIQQAREQFAALPIHPFWLGIVNGLIAGLTVNAIAAFGEELGWRGLLHKEFEHLGFWRSSVLIGVIWGVWHAPVILQGYNYPQNPQIGVVMMTLFTTLFSPLIAYARVRGRSVIAAAIMHGSLNGTYGLSIMLIHGGTDLTVGMLGAAGFSVLVLANLGLFLYMPRERTPERY